VMNDEEDEKNSVYIPLTSRYFFALAAYRFSEIASRVGLYACFADFVGSGVICPALLAIDWITSAGAYYHLALKPDGGIWHGDSKWEFIVFPIVGLAGWPVPFSSGGHDFKFGNLSIDDKHQDNYMPSHWAMRSISSLIAIPFVIIGLMSGLDFVATPSYTFWAVLGLSSFVVQYVSLFKVLSYVHHFTNFREHDKKFKHDGSSKGWEATEPFKIHGLEWTKCCLSKAHQITSGGLRPNSQIAKEIDHRDSEVTSVQA